MIYIFCFIWAPAFTYLAQKQFRANNKIGGWCLLILAILIPSIVAGLRALDVGRDAKSYVSPMVQKAISTDFISYMASGGSLEVGYKLLMYPLSNIAPSANFALFIMQFLTMLFVCLYAYSNRNKTNMVFVMIIYMLVFYCLSFTYIRQSLAISIILYSTVFFEKKKYLLTFLLFLLATSIHITSIVAVVIYALMFVSQSKISPKNKKIIYISYVVLLVLGTIFFTQIVYFLTNIIPILPEKYNNYAQFYSPDKPYSMLSELAMRLFFIACAILYMRFVKKKDSKFDIVVILLFLLTDFATFILTYKVVNMSRLGLYFLYPALFLLLPNLKQITKDKRRQTAIIAGIIIVLFGLWVWKYPIKQWCEVMPYKSDIIIFLQ